MARYSSGWSDLLPTGTEAGLALGALDPAKAGVAMALLGGYGAERQGMIADNRHMVAGAQQLAQQEMMIKARQAAVENFLKATKQGTEVPGLMDMYASGGLTRDLFGGVDNQAYRDTAAAIARSSSAQNLERAGKGMENMVQGGITPGTDYIRAVLGDPTAQATTPLALQLKAAGGGGAGSEGVRYTYALTDGTSISGKAPSIPEAVARANAAKVAATGQRTTSALANVQKIAPTVYNQIRLRTNGDRGKAEAMARQFLQQRATNPAFGTQSAATE